jgi:hypothetical protein
LYFSQFILELFGHAIPNAFLSFFRESGFVIVAGIALLFAVAWLARAMPRHHAKIYHLICFDVFGKELILDGLRTKFRNNDVAWSFMKEYKERHPLYSFGLTVVDVDSNSFEKKTLIRYI